MQKEHPILKSKSEIEAMKEAGRISAKALRMAGEIVQPGISTAEIDSYIENVIRMLGGTPSFKGLYGFPGSACLSLNDMIVHGIPNKRTICQNGDIISIDTGATVDGWVGDNAATFAVGTIKPQIQALLDATKASLYEGIAQAQVGNHIGDIGHAIQTYCEERGLGVVRDYIGHGVGRKMHEDPAVPNFGKPGRGLRLEEGLVIAIEPMINLGTHNCHVILDGWGVVTDDGLPSAHFENTIAVTADGPVIITKE
ncbi:MAG: type I methionyl aminopeptidase [Coriobacteriales bacterium]|nr:type I methionyl aminopeptidase [Coriobacteriales bacterium]